MSEDSFDDGLVHSHSWATEPAPTTVRPAAIRIPARDDDHDDGLVHSHGWACGERGRKSH